MREFFKEKVFHTVIPRNVRLGEAPSHGMPVILYDVKSRGAEAYLALAREMLARNGRARRTTSIAATTLKATMADKRPALGRGLDALIRDALEAPARTPGTRLRGRHRPARRRTATSRASHADDARIDELARSIKSNGVIQPIVVRRVGRRATRSSPANAAGAPRSAPAC